MFSRGLKIIREGDEYYVVHQGEIQRHLGSLRQGKHENSSHGILDSILFFIGDMEVATSDAKRRRLL